MPLQKEFINPQRYINLETSKMIRKASQSLELVTPKQPKPLQYAELKYKDKTIQLPVLIGTFNNKLLDIRHLLAKTGYMTFDPGFNCTANCASTITYIDGEKGKLFYRGYSIQSLSQKASLMETYYLLFYGSLPSESELVKFEETVVGEMMINEKLIQFYKGFKSSANPMAIMVGVVGALAAFIHADFDLFNPDDRQQLAIKLIAKMPTLAAYAYRTSMGLPIVYPKKNLGYMKNFLYMMFSNPMDEQFIISEQIVRIMEKIWICHADHQQGPSTSTVRIAGSSLADPFACIAAAIGSLWGPFHGGADCVVLQILQEIQKRGLKIEEVLKKSKEKDNKMRLMGFGHRVYKSYDPRAAIMKKLCFQMMELMQFEKDSPEKKTLELALKIQQEALKDQYFIKRKLFPNIDYYTGMVYNAIGIPKEMFTVCFAVSRSVGWMAHWCEMMNENLNRISRPRQLYVGKTHRPYVKIQQREKVDHSRVKQGKKLNKLTKLTKV